MSRRRNPFLDLGLDMARLGLESSGVIGLRVMRAALGAGDVRKEAALMISEKAKAAFDAQMIIAHSVMSGQGHLAPARTVALYRRRAQANRRRLTRRT
jgi:hypothetical protein